MDREQQRHPGVPAELERLRAELAAVQDAAARLQRELDGAAQRAEHDAHRIAVLRAIRGVQRRIARARQPGSLLAGVCETLVDAGGYRGAWIALVDGGRYLAQAAGSGAAAPAGELPPCCHQALSVPAPLIVADPAAECPACPLAPREAGVANLRVRLMHEGKAFGVLCVSLPGAFAAQPAEQALFAELAADVAFALHRLEQEQRRSSAQQLIAEYSGLLGTIVEARDEELKQAAAALRSKDLAVRSSLAGIAITDAQGRLSYVNPSFLAITGCADEQQALAVDWRAYAQRAEDVDALLDALRTAGRWIGELPARRQDGAPVELHLAASMIADEQGQPVGVVVSIVDVTERARLQQRLLQAERLATMGQLAGGVGHELRNPLGAIKNIGVLLRMSFEQPPPDVAESLEMLDDQIAAAVRIVDSLLDYSRPREPQRTAAELAGIVRQALKLTHVPAGVLVQVDLAADLPAVLVDPDQLLHVVANIVRNAGQAMATGGTLRIDAAAGADGFVTLRFADTGQGIAPADLPRVFELLFTTKARGMGIGLSLCKLLVERNGGSIAVESERGQGSLFTVRLPVAPLEGARR